MRPRAPARLKVGVSGAVAINIVTDTSQALIETGASVAAGGGDVNVTSLNASTELTFAVPAGAATGDSLGVGASVALNIITNNTQSEIENGAALTGAGNVAVTANSSHTITTWGQNGAAGGVATAGGVAVAIASDQTTAQDRLRLEDARCHGWSYARSDGSLLGELAGRLCGKP